MAKIGFIGLGNMGTPMATNLVRHGHSVRGFDLSTASREAAAKAGIKIEENAESTISDANYVLTMLPAGEHVISVYTQILKAAKTGALFVDCSTIDVESARTAHKLAQTSGMLSLDAPVSGGTNGAAAATLTFMAGGSVAAYEAAMPILEGMGKKFVHCGEGGAGQAAKLCNNMVLGISMIAVSEAFVLAEKLGLSHQALFDVASTSSAQCWSLTSYCPVAGPVPASPANHEYQPGFATSLMLKDLRLSQQAAKAANAHTELGAQAEKIYQSLEEHGDGDADFSIVIRAIRARSSMQLP
jgi:3-hydroxyisobutyrate dehydrogenase